MFYTDSGLFYTYFMQFNEANQSKLFPNFPSSKKVPRTALKVTAEKVLNLSNNPNTAFGIIPVPIGPSVASQSFF
jgi:hypothetical protein